MKAIFSDIDIYGSSPVAKEYMECVNDIFYKECFNELKAFKHHHYTCRFCHSLNVSYYSFLFCKILGWNKYAAARAGLMHDLYYYEGRIKQHLKLHPCKARDNALGICTLDPVVEDAILKHMWPVTKGMPSYRESYVVCFTDKFCAAAEYLAGSCKKILKYRN